ncbi:hypothetical protein [Actinoallomurus sp. NPDC052274]|uniref:hypothetical protein n=1 Tax=Actinoallomurus sp. NPDC052274 TaxID=3155420 RepID=UPI00343ADF85
MIWLVWTQYRRQFTYTATLVGALAVLLIVTGAVMNSDYHSALAHCGTAGDCGNLGLFQGSGWSALTTAVPLTVGVPILLGVFWGAPLVAGEYEQGTQQFVWTQSIPRRRWLLTKIGWALSAAAVWGSVVAASVTWWSRTENALNHHRFDPFKFDVQGVVPVAYAVFAVALGIAAGAVLRRTLPALGVTVAGFTTLLLVLQSFVRPHYLPMKTANLPLSRLHGGLLSGSWQFGGQVLDPTGQVVGHVIGGNDWNIQQAIPANCVLNNPDSVRQCLSADGYRMVVHYQPASRYWTFQFIEAGLFLALAAVLVLIAYRAISRRDA